MINDITSVICVKKEVFVYLLPPAQSTTRGYRAGEWDLQNPKFTVRARVVTKASQLVILLEDQNSGDLFAECPVDSYPGIEIQQVNDSSRYFVIRLKSPEGKTKFVGIGFADRQDSFDFLLNIRDHFERLKNEISAEEALKQLREAPSLNMGLKEGQTMRIQIKTKRINDQDEKLPTNTQSRPQISLGTTLGSGLLPPPPPGVASRSKGSGSGIPAIQKTSALFPTNTSENINPPGSSMLSFDSESNFNLIKNDAPRNLIPHQYAPKSLIDFDFDPFSASDKSLTQDFNSWEKF